MARRILTTTTSDFRGGINYGADAFQYGDNEVADARNVDFDVRGGFQQRDAIRAWNVTGFGSVPTSIWGYLSSGGTGRVMVQRGVTVTQCATADGVFVNVGGITGSAGKMRAATVNDVCYMQRNAEATAVKWDGTTVTTLTDVAVAPSYTEYGVPVSGTAPKGRLVVAHNNMLFHGNLIENAASRPHRIRWSHPVVHGGSTLAECYRVNDFIDVNPGDGDAITALVSFAGQLMIFKDRTTWVLHGYDSDSFQLVQVSPALGAVSQEAVASADNGVYFFSWPQGLCFYDGTSVTNLFERMIALVEDKSVANAGNVTVGVVRDRVWVGLTLLDQVTNESTLVYDPRITSWTRYDAPCGAFLAYRLPLVAAQYFALNPAAGRVLELHGGALAQDRFTDVDLDIDSWVRTTWQDLDDPAVVKRWKRPLVVCDGDVASAVNVDIYKDYDASSSIGSFVILLDAAGVGSVWSDPSPLATNGARWADTDGTGTAVGFWGNADTGAQVVEKGGILGTARSVALKFSNTTTPSVAWGVSALTYKYIPKKVKA